MRNCLLKMLITRKIFVSNIRPSTSLVARARCTTGPRRAVNNASRNH